MVNSIKGLSDINTLSNTKKSKLESSSFEESLNNAIQKGEDKNLKNACVEFESYFLNMMFKSMRRTVLDGGGLFKRSNAEKIFQEMLDEQMSKDAAKQGGFGLSDMMYKQLSKNKNISEN